MSIISICIVSVVGKPAGSQCSGGSATECQCGTECLPWTPGGGSLHCLYPQPLAHLESCNYTERRQLCDTGLMCDQGVCVRADKYMWDKMFIRDEGYRYKTVKLKLLFIGFF